MEDGRLAERCELSESTGDDARVYISFGERNVDFATQGTDNEPPVWEDL
jgi:hypothetical protein